LTAPRTQAGPVGILYVIEAMHRGGTEMQLLKLIQGLDRRRFVPHLCTLKPSSIPPESAGCESLELPFRSFARIDTPALVMRLRRFVRKRRIRLVQTFFQDPAILGFLASRASGVGALVGSFRDLGFWRTPFKAFQLRLVYPRFDGFIANSNAVAEHFHAADRIPLERIEVIPNALDPPGQVLPAPEVAAMRERGPVVGIVANLNRRVKRVDLFLRAAAEVARAHPRAGFVVVGEGSLEGELRALVASLGISDRVLFTGRAEDPYAWIAGFDLGVICSDNEGFSNAVLEYMAMGVPPVVTDVGGNPEAVRGGVDGLLVPPDDPLALAGALARLLRDPALGRRLGERARATVRERYSVEACVSRHERYYESILSEGRA
jgi:L-malate glycosyltransferase